MTDTLKEKLVMALVSLRDEGKTPEQAVLQIIQAFGGSYADVARISMLNVGLVAEVLYSVYQDTITAREIAAILLKMGNPAQDVVTTVRGYFHNKTP